MKRAKKKKKRKRVRVNAPEWRNPVVFPLPFILAINLDGHLDTLADLAEKSRDA